MKRSIVILCCIVAMTLAANGFCQDKPDPDMVARIAAAQARLEAAKAAAATRPTSANAQPTTAPTANVNHQPKLRADAPDEVKALVRGTNAARRIRLTDLDHAISDTLADAAQQKRIGETVAAGDLEKNAQSMKRERVALAKALIVPPHLDDAKKFAVGAIGFVRLGHVIQIIDDHTMIVVASPYRGYIPPGTKSQSWSATPASIYLVGLSTAGMTDDNRTLEIIMPIYINGTHQYGDVSGGTSTLLQAESFDETKYEEKP